jgi:hypothetical protein
MEKVSLIRFLFFITMGDASRNAQQDEEKKLIVTLNVVKGLLFEVLRRWKEMRVLIRFRFFIALGDASRNAQQDEGKKFNRYPECSEGAPVRSFKVLGGKSEC